jgi:hypothetical protein
VKLVLKLGEVVLIYHVKGLMANSRTLTDLRNHLGLSLLDSHDGYLDGVVQKLKCLLRPGSLLQQDQGFGAVCKTPVVVEIPVLALVIRYHRRQGEKKKIITHTQVNLSGKLLKYVSVLGRNRCAQRS